MAMPKASTATNIPSVAGTIVETMNASGYTYMLVDSGDKKTWVAIPATTVEKGAEIKYYQGMVMENFTSKTLDRTFDAVVFSSGLAGEEDETAPQPAPGKSQRLFLRRNQGRKKRSDCTGTGNGKYPVAVSEQLPRWKKSPLKKQLLPTATLLRKSSPKPKNSPVKKFRSMAKSSNSAR